MTDARKLDRFQLPLPTRIIPTDDAGKGSLQLVTADVCAGGAFFLTHQVLPEGTDVELEMDMPVARFRSHGKTLQRVVIHVRGTVLRNNETGMAIRFEGQHRFYRHAA